VIPKEAILMFLASGLFAAAYFLGQTTGRISGFFSIDRTEQPERFRRRQALYFLMAVIGFIAAVAISVGYVLFGIEPHWISN